MKKEKLRKYIILAMLAAMAFILAAVIKIPVVLFLDYEPKDVVITIGGFLFGPVASAGISLVVSFLEMVTISSTGPIGAFMNFLATCSFSCTAAYIYKKKHTIKGAAIGLVSGIVLMTVVMILWNYIITPFYMGVTREAVAELLLPAILPFNLLKAGLNASFTLLLYKPVVTALRKAHLLPSPSGTAKKGRSIGVTVVALAAIATCIILVLALKGII